MLQSGKHQKRGIQRTLGTNKKERIRLWATNGVVAVPIIGAYLAQLGLKSKRILNRTMTGAPVADMGNYSKKSRKEGR